MPGEQDGQATQQSIFRNKQFAGYLAVTVPIFTIGLLATMATDLGVRWAYTIGFAASVPVEFVREWFLDWREAEAEVSADV